jgi:hypothetical protein
MPPQTNPDPHRIHLIPAPLLPAEPRHTSKRQTETWRSGHRAGDDLAVFESLRVLESGIYSSWRDDERRLSNGEFPSPAQLGILLFGLVWGVEGMESLEVEVELEVGRSVQVRSGIGIDSRVTKHTCISGLTDTCHRLL